MVKVVHKATPADPEAHATSCLVCKEAVHRVPGGNGPTYVHTATGAVARVTEQSKLEGQIIHIREHQQEFNDHQVSATDVDVATYFHDYGDYTNTYINLCSDLGLTPRPGLT